MILMNSYDCLVLNVPDVQLSTDWPLQSSPDNPSYIVLPSKAAKFHATHSLPKFIEHMHFSETCWPVLKSFPHPVRVF